MGFAWIWIWDLGLEKVSKLLGVLMANPSGNHHEASQPSSSFDGGNPSNGNSTHVPVADNSSSAIAMKHNPGISTDWTSDEQVTLEEGLKK